MSNVRRRCRWGEIVGSIVFVDDPHDDEFRDRASAPEERRVGDGEVELRPVVAVEEDENGIAIGLRFVSRRRRHKNRALLIELR